MKINYDVLEKNEKIPIKDLLKILNVFCKVCGGLSVKRMRMEQNLTSYVCERYDQGDNKKENTKHYWDSMKYRLNDGVLMFILYRYNIIKEDEEEEIKEKLTLEQEAIETLERRNKEDEA